MTTFAQKPFTFSADCKALEQSIKKVLAVVGPQAAFFLGLYRKSVCVFGLSSDTFAMLTVPNSETTDTIGIFSFDAAVVPGLIKNRSVMEFKFSGTECQFQQTKGRYKGGLPTTQVTDDQIEQLTEKVYEKSQKAASISADLWSAIKVGVAAAAVKDVYQNTTLMSYVMLSKEGKLVISSFDAQHFGLYRGTVEAKGTSFRAALPQSHFALIEQMSGGGDTSFSLSQARLRASGKGFIVVLPATQAEEKHFNMVPEFIKSLPKPMYSCECSVEKLATIADNLNTLYTANSNLDLKVKGPVLTLGLSTSSGSASDSVKVKGEGKDIKFSIDPRLFMDVLALARSCKDVDIKVTDKIFTIYGKAASGNIALACARAS